MNIVFCAHKIESNADHNEKKSREKKNPWDFKAGGL